MSRKLVGGVVWQTMHYLAGLRRLGYDVYYVEAHGAPPTWFMQDGSDGSAGAAAFLAHHMQRFGFADRWAFHALHSDGACYGLSESALSDLYRSADAIINLHGATAPRPEHIASDRLVFLETDPVAVQIRLCEGVQKTIDLLSPHRAFFTFGENYGHPDCGLPISESFTFRPTRQPVVLDFWRAPSPAPRTAFTTVGNWAQPDRDLVFHGEVYHWSKHHEYLTILDLPARTGQCFELALAQCDDADRDMLERHGWRVRDAFSFSQSLDAYRSYIVSSRAEFTVAKDQNIRLRSGWFSDRSATYLAAGRPVITQETGFSNILPTGEGLLAFSTIEEAAEAVDQVNADYDRHSRAAEAIAREYFSHDVVLPRLLAEIGL